MCRTTLYYAAASNFITSSVMTPSRRDTSLQHFFPTLKKQQRDETEKMHSTLSKSKLSDRLSSVQNIHRTKLISETISNFVKEDELPQNTNMASRQTLSSTVNSSESDNERHCSFDDEDFVPSSLTTIKRRKRKAKARSKSTQVKNTEKLGIKCSATIDNAFSVMMNIDQQVLVDSKKDNNVVCVGVLNRDSVVDLVGENNKENFNINSQLKDENSSYNVASENCSWESVSSETSAAKNGVSLKDDETHLKICLTLRKKKENNNFIKHVTKSNSFEKPIENYDASSGISNNCIPSIENINIPECSSKSLNSLKQMCNNTSTRKKNLDAFSVLMSNCSKKVTFDVENESDLSLEEVAPPPKKTITDFFSTPTPKKHGSKKPPTFVDMTKQLATNAHEKGPIKLAESESHNTKLSDDCGKKDAIFNEDATVLTQTLDSSMEDFEIVKKNHRLDGWLNNSCRKNKPNLNNAQISSFSEKDCSDKKNPETLNNIIDNDIEELANNRDEATDDEVFIFDSDDDITNKPLKKRMQVAKTQLVFKATKKLMNKKLLKSIGSVRDGTNTCQESTISDINEVTKCKILDSVSNANTVERGNSEHDNDTGSFHQPEPLITDSTDSAHISDTNDDNDSILDALTAKMYELSKKGKDKCHKEVACSEDESTLDELTSKMHNLTKKLKKPNTNKSGKMLMRYKRKLSKLRKGKKTFNIVMDNSEQCKEIDTDGTEPDLLSIHPCATSDQEDDDAVGGDALHSVMANDSADAVLRASASEGEKEDFMAPEKKIITKFFKKVTKAEADIGRDKSTVTVRVEVHQSHDSASLDKLIDSNAAGAKCCHKEVGSCAGRAEAAAVGSSYAALDMDAIEFHGEMDLDGTEDTLLQPTPPTPVRLLSATNSIDVIHQHLACDNSEETNAPHINVLRVQTSDTKQSVMPSNKQCIPSTPDAADGDVTKASAKPSSEALTPLTAANSTSPASRHCSKLRSVATILHPKIVEFNYELLSVFAITHLNKNVY